jgi:protein-S-isoprenylcysteine O-methyltransferase Ste14
MINGVSSVILLNFIFIGLLPKIFFKKDGKYNLHWWITAGPLFISPIVLLLMDLGYLSPMSAPIEQPAAVLSTISIGLISFTLGTHRVPLALWHQTNDAPHSIVTWGAYKRIRHPFYTSFILSQFAAAMAAPHIITLAALAYAISILTYTAKKEESKLSASQYGEEYKSYMKATGRFIPRVMV